MIACNCGSLEFCFDEEGMMEVLEPGFIPWAHPF